MRVIATVGVVFALAVFYRLGEIVAHNACDLLDAWKRRH